MVVTSASIPRFIFALLLLRQCEPDGSTHYEINDQLFDERRTPPNLTGHGYAIPASHPAPIFEEKLSRIIKRRCDLSSAGFSSRVCIPLVGDSPPFRGR